MSRFINVAAAQLGPIQRADSRKDVMGRLLAHLHQAHAMGCQLVVFPELALTTFFPRWYMEDPVELDSFYESEMPGPQTRILFDTAAKLKLGFYLGYAELTVEHGVRHRHNSSILVGQDGAIIGKYRKVHLPGH